MAGIRVIVRRADGAGKGAELGRALARWQLTTAADLESTWKANTPVVTGTLRRSVHTERTGTGYTVGTDVEYAPFVEYGTRYMAARAPATRAVEAVRPRAEAALRAIVASLG